MARDYAPGKIVSLQPSATVGWAEMNAAQNSRIYCIRDEFLNTPAPTLTQGLRAWAFAIHPELFPQPRSTMHQSQIAKQYSVMLIPHRAYQSEKSYNDVGADQNHRIIKRVGL